MNKAGEAEKVAACHSLADEVDWPCEVLTQYQETNLGCRWGVIAAINWFFKNEEFGIILEDDIVADVSFFPFCAELLERYRNQPRIMAISGSNFQANNIQSDNSYHFSCFNHVWGWASWRRAWELYDTGMGGIETRETMKAIQSQSSVPGFYEYWMKKFRGVAEGKIDSWDYGWMLACWQAGGLTCAPNVNLIRNIGFGEDATHTLDADSPRANLSFGKMEFPLSHPEVIEQMRSVDDSWARNGLGIGRRYHRRKVRKAIVAAIRNIFQFGRVRN